MKVFYTAGSGNAFACFGDFLAGREDLSTSHVAYSRQFYDSCIRHGFEARVTCSFPAGVERMAGRGMELLYRPDLSVGKSGFAFQRSLFVKARQVMAEARDFGADLVLLSEDAVPALYAPLAREGVRIVQILQTMLWGCDPSLMQRLRLSTYGRAYRRHVTAVLSASHAVTRQVRHLAGEGACPILEFLPLYQTGYYEGVAKPDAQAPRLDIAYIGRVEANKGALDMVEIARLGRERGLPLHYHICGTGGGFDEMRARVAAYGLEALFTFHGWCDRAGLRRVLGRCQIVMVPTRSEICEGFNHVVVEAALAGRLALASDVCPAIDYLGSAARSVKADDPSAFLTEIEHFAKDRQALDRALAATRGAGQRFHDPATSFGAALDQIFAALGEGRSIADRIIPPQA